VGHGLVHALEGGAIGLIQSPNFSGSATRRLGPSRKQDFDSIFPSVSKVARRHALLI
jgi:hypothetical protein